MPAPRRALVPALAVLALAAAAPTARAQEVSLTIYNQGFAVVRDHVRVELKPGDNRVAFAGATAHVEPDSVILRDPAGKAAFVVREQDYRADQISQGLLLQLNEGRDIDFRVVTDGKESIVRGTVVRSGYRHPPAATPGMPYWRVQQLQAQAYAEQGQPIIRVDGKLRFSLPGEPLFPQLGDDTILKPTLEWLIGASEATSFDAEVGYVSGGLSWQAAYNVVASEAGEDRIDLAGWVTIDNHCGTDFADARIKLVAGDVAKVEEQDQGYQMAAAKAMRSEMDALDIGVTSKPFSDYHLYTLPRPTLLRDHETKQEAFLDARGVTCVKRLVYDGLALDAPRYRGWSPDNIRNQREFGTASNPKVWVMREFVNAAANHLGMPLPAGRMRFYLRDADGQLEFTGENDIDHTPADEKVRVYTGNAFDVVGERRQTDYHLDLEHSQLDETFSITVRNHRDQPAEVSVVEHLYRWVNWEVRANSQPFAKRDSRTIEYPVTVPAKGEKTVTYTAHYSW